MQYKKLKDIADLIGGYAFKSDKYVGSGIRVIRIANVQDGYISDDYPCFYPLNKEAEIGNAILKENDLLMSLTGNVGRVAILSRDLLPAGLNQRVECIRPKNINLKQYLYYYFRSEHFKQIAEKNSSGIAQLNMSTIWLGEHQIPIYESEKTFSIVKQLRTVDDLIALEQKHLNLYDELIKSRFIEMFGNPLINEKSFPTKPLNIACPFNKYKGDVVTVNNKVWILNLDMIESNTGRIIEKIYQSENEIGNSTIKFDINCVLYSKLRPYLNKVVVPDASGYGTSELISMQTGKDINPQYLASLLRTESFVSYIDSKTAGAKICHLQCQPDCQARTSGA